jgi:endonuclease/exonuclease/phosphatase family metal-dependent hydrolase
MKIRLFKIFLLSGLACCLSLNYPQFSYAKSTAVTISSEVLQVQTNDVISTLSFGDLINLSKTNQPEKEIAEKLDYVLHTPIVHNSSSNQIKLNNSEVLGNYVRVAAWNVARGLNIEKIQALLKNHETLINNEKKLNFNKAEIEKQINILKNTDIFLLNEVDIGMPRTNYKNIAEELSRTLGYNYAYGVEFVEVDPTHLGLEDNKWSEERILFPDKKYIVDKTKYKGLHGNAIISKFPLNNVRIIRLPNTYDWFNSEKSRIAEIEYLRRHASDKLFKEEVIREVRQGSRIALLADVQIPGLDKPVTVISVHLENRTLPKYRQKQIAFLLEQIKTIKNPVILAGDFNTTASDASPTSIRREVYKKLSDPQFLARQAILCAVPYSFVVSSVNESTNFLRTYKNPVVRNYPIIAPNKERKLFKILEHFEFDDDGEFDFSGDKIKSSNRRNHILANSNQRDLRGFTPTYIFERPLLIGKFKLDWIFVKPLHECDTCDKKVDEKCKPVKCKGLEPYFGRTLHEMNYAFGNPISDHSPVTVDLPLTKPDKNTLKHFYKLKTMP